MSDLRPSVVRFAVAMEERLSARDQRSGFRGWEDDSLVSLLAPLKRRYEHLIALVEVGADTARIADEAAHLGNYAMMLFDLAYDDWMVALQRTTGQSVPNAPTTHHNSGQCPDCGSRSHKWCG